MIKVREVRTVSPVAHPVRTIALTTFCLKDFTVSLVLLQSLSASEFHYNIYWNSHSQVKFVRRDTWKLYGVKELDCILHLFIFFKESIDWQIRFFLTRDTCYKRTVVVFNVSYFWARMALVMIQSLDERVSVTDNNLQSSSKGVRTTEVFDCVR